MAHLLRGSQLPATNAPSCSSGSHNNGFNFGLPRFCSQNRMFLTPITSCLTNHKTTGGCPRPFGLAYPCAALSPNVTITSYSESIGAASDAEDDGLAEAAERESKQVLEWPAICKQVACFCGTSVAADLAARGHLPRARSREEAERLLQQTAEAVEANLQVQGCFDIRPAVDAAAAGALLNAKQLEGVAATLEAAFALKAVVSAAEPAEGGGGGGGGGRPAAPRRRFPSLAGLAEGISDEERTLLRAIRACIQLNTVCNEASEALAEVRMERQTNKEALRREVEQWARLMQSRGAAEPGAVALVRGRFCVGVRAGRQGELPKGSVRLSASSTGATLYVEPRPCVELNNREALLAEREEAEVQRVLALLSGLLGSRGAAVLGLLDCVTSLDLVAARAAHSRWMGAVRPSFTEDPDASPLHLPGALHPVLMQRGLPPLPQAPSVDDNRFDRDFQAAPAWELRRVLLPEGPRSGEAPEGLRAEGPGAEPAGGEAAPSRLLPKPLDLRVPPGRAVVAITGPNTGGKTVTLKAAGLMVLMAQAGLYLPCDPAALATHGSPALAWFDRVLADIGDAQSLQQSLSTFSGHIRRIRQILATAGPRSLVLLDEVGSGTDPLEGAALARAVLDRLAAQAHLTLATTHHAELKRASEQDGRYVNVSMAFDTATLRPTYQLRWGAAGASNALDIAETLGFDRSVVLEARNVAQALAASSNSSSSISSSPSDGFPEGEAEGRDSHIAVVARSLVRQLDETRLELDEQRRLRQKRQEAQALLQDTIGQVREMEQQLKLSPREIVMERDSLAADLQSALDAFAAGLQPQTSVEEVLSRIEALIPEEVAAYRGRGHPGGAAGEDGEEGDEDREALRPGDPVYIRSYGDMGSAKVVSVKGDYVTVKFDILPFGARARSGRSKKFHKREVQRVSRGGGGPLLPSSGWMSDYSSLDSDIKKVLGEVSAEEKRAAAEAAARRRSQQLAEEAAEEAGHASYSDLYNALDVDEVAEDLDSKFEDPDLEDLVDSLRQVEDGDDDDDGIDKDSVYGISHGRNVNGNGASAGPRRRPRPGPAKPAAALAGTDGGGGAAAAGLSLPPQTGDNTLDVSGEVPELAADEVDERISSAPQGSVLYVRHGTGTGAVRDAVHGLLTRRLGAKGRVRQWREAPGSRGEVTVVWL